MKRKRLLILGVSGQLGNNLAYAFRKHYEVGGTYFRNPLKTARLWTSRCDIHDKRDIVSVLDAFSPEILIHCAALADVNACEENTDLAHALNHLATKHIVDSLQNRNVKLVYISSDSVYAGDTGAHAEDGHVRPRNYYGLSKYFGEWESLRLANALILRSNFFGWNVQRKESLGEWILHSLRNHERIKGFADAVFSSMYTMDLAAILHVALKRDLHGVYNCGTCDAVSKLDFARKFAQRCGVDAGLILPANLADQHFVARRGRDLSMDVGKIESALGLSMPTTEACIERFCNDFETGLPDQLKHFWRVQ